MTGPSTFEPDEMGMQWAAKVATEVLEADGQAVRYSIAYAPDMTCPRSRHGAETPRRSPDADDRSLARRQIGSVGPCSGCGLGDGVVEMGEAARAVAVRLEMGAHGPGCF